MHIHYDKKILTIILGLTWLSLAPLFATSLPTTPTSKSKGDTLVLYYDYKSVKSDRSYKDYEISNTNTQNNVFIGFDDNISEYSNESNTYFPPITPSQNIVNQNIVNQSTTNFFSEQQNLVNINDITNDSFLPPNTSSPGIHINCVPPKKTTQNSNTPSNKKHVSFRTESTFNTSSSTLTNGDFALGTPSQNTANTDLFNASNASIFSTSSSLDNCTEYLTDEQIKGIINPILSLQHQERNIPYPQKILTADNLSDIAHEIAYSNVAREDLTTFKYRLQKDGTIKQRLFNTTDDLNDNQKELISGIVDQIKKVHEQQGASYNVSQNTASYYNTLHNQGIFDNNAFDNEKEKMIKKIIAQTLEYFFHDQNPFKPLKLKPRQEKAILDILIENTNVGQNELSERQENAVAVISQTLALYLSGLQTNQKEKIITIKQLQAMVDYLINPYGKKKKDKYNRNPLSFLSSQQIEEFCIEVISTCFCFANPNQRRTLKNQITIWRNYFKKRSTSIKEEEIVQIINNIAHQKLGNDMPIRFGFQPSQYEAIRNTLYGALYNYVDPPKLPITNIFAHLITGMHFKKSQEKTIFDRLKDDLVPYVFLLTESKKAIIDDEIMKIHRTSMHHQSSLTIGDPLVLADKVKGLNPSAKNLVTHYIQQKHQTNPTDIILIGPKSAGKTTLAAAMLGYPLYSKENNITILENKKKGQDRVLKRTLKEGNQLMLCYNLPDKNRTPFMDTPPFDKKFSKAALSFQRFFTTNHVRGILLVVQPRDLQPTIPNKDPLSTPIVKLLTYLASYFSNTKSIETYGKTSICLVVTQSKNEVVERKTLTRLIKNVLNLTPITTEAKKVHALLHTLLKIPATEKNTEELMLDEKNIVFFPHLSPQPKKPTVNNPDNNTGSNGIPKECYKKYIEQINQRISAFIGIYQGAFASNPGYNRIPAKFSKPSKQSILVTTNTSNLSTLQESNNIDDIPANNTMPVETNINNNNETPLATPKIESTPSNTSANSTPNTPKNEPRNSEFRSIKEPTETEKHSPVETNINNNNETPLATPKTESTPSNAPTNSKPNTPRLSPNLRRKRGINQ